MEIVVQKAELINVSPNPEYIAELSGRTCYQSIDKMGSDVEFIERLIRNGHLSVIEHISLTFKLITNRAIMSELTRHRLASYSVESTRYTRYGGGITVIDPMIVDNDVFKIWIDTMIALEESYLKLLEMAGTEIARGVLPLDLKTEIVMTANVREWRHIFNLRLSSRAHKQMRQLMYMALNEIWKDDQLKIFFKDIYDMARAGQPTNRQL